MAHYAKVENNIVTQVVVVGEDYVEQLKIDHPGEWIQTSYNTFGGVHALGGVPLRKNYAGIGYTYDRARDAFIPQKDYASWVLNEDTCQWEPPIPYPSDGLPYVWNELTRNWVAINDPQIVHEDIEVTKLGE